MANDRDPFDSAQQAMDIKDLNHRAELLQVQLKNALEGMTSALQSVQVEQRAATIKLEQVVSLQASQDNSREAIEHLRQGQVDLTSRLESWFDDQDRRSEQWRREHEAENEDTARALRTMVQDTRESLIRILAWSGGAGAVVGVLVLGFVGFLNFRFNASDSELRKESVRIEIMLGRLREVELYLARGGTHSSRPFITDQQAPKEATHE